MSHRTAPTLARQIAQNLWWCWQPEVAAIFSEIDADLWRRVRRNPLAFLDELGDEAFAKAARHAAIEPRLGQLARRLEEYLGATGPRLCPEAGPLHAAPIAYFCAEFGIHESLRIYSGGLGVLAGDHVKACSDLGIPLVGVGLYYARGYFRQSVDEGGWQQEHYDVARTESLPMRKVMDEGGAPIEVAVESEEGTIRAHCWALEVGRVALYLLDADVEANSEEDRALTSLLYGGDRRTRIRQELLLGVGGVRLLERLGIEPGVYHLNEGHSAFAPLELCARAMEREGHDFEKARRQVSERVVFTTHTPVPAGHDRFELELLERTMGPVRERLGLSHRDFHGLGRVVPDDAGESFCMTVLAIKMSDRRNGVSHLHGRVSRAMWRELFPSAEPAGVPIGHITNGVHVASFLAPRMRDLYDKHLPADWRARMDEAASWRGILDVDPGELWQTHQQLKVDLIRFIRRRVGAQACPSGSGEGQVVPGSGFTPDVLTIGFARRFATYKRANLVFRDMERFLALVADADRPVQFVFSGKAHPADDGGKRLIQDIVKATVDPAFGGRVVFLADYDMNIARHMVSGVDVWLNNPRRPQEACGTSGQKTVLNGALNCSILDGWWAEGYDGKNGFAIGSGREFARTEDQDAHDADALYAVLQDEILPLYYGERDSAGMPVGWVERMVWAIASLGPRFNADRMVLDYLRSAYLPAVGATIAEAR